MGRILEKAEVELCARAAHDINRNWNKFTGGVIYPEFDLLSDEDRETAIQSVIGIVQNDFGPEQTHLHWVASKKVKGWTYGDKYDLERKQHPCMKPYAELEPEVRAKDELWVDTVRMIVKNLWKTLKN